MENHFSALNPWNQKTFLGNMFVISITYAPLGYLDKKKYCFNIITRLYVRNIYTVYNWTDEDHILTLSSRTCVKLFKILPSYFLSFLFFIVFLLWRNHTAEEKKDINFPSEQFREGIWHLLMEKNILLF